MPFNANKAGEHGKAPTDAAARGDRRGAAIPRATGSTLTESDAPRPRPARQADARASIRGNLPLDRVRVDSAGRALTTNQGVPVADNQNSLKAGLRGPALLEDFILREKITHFDHERIPGAHRPRARLGGARLLRVLRAADATSRAPRSSPRPASARRCSCASRPSSASAARPTRRATCAASRSSSTPTRATGTSSATTSRCSSSRTR